MQTKLRYNWKQSWEKFKHQLQEFQYENINTNKRKKEEEDDILVRGKSQMDKAIKIYYHTRNKKLKKRHYKIVVF